MALLTSVGSEDGLEYSNQPEEDEEYVSLASQGSTEQMEEEEGEEEYVCLSSHGSTKEQEEEDEEQRVLCEVLCADRVGQMTKTYSDIDAVTRLLEEKERDLELAARIGQSLLKKNKTLSERNELLEEQVEHIREEASNLETETISYEEKEQQLVNDCVKELRDANLQISSLAEELARKTEDASRQQEEITHLLSQIVDLQKKAKMYAVENEELTQHLGAAKDAQRQLTAELRELQDKYVECMEMLHEAQEELKNLRNKTLPLNTQRRFHSLGLFPMDSLAAEIEGTMRKELQMDDPDVEEQRLQPKRVFQTVKNLNLMRQQRSSLAPSPLNIPGSNQTSCFTSGRSSRVGTPCSNSIYGSGTGSGIILDNRTSSILESPDDGSEDSNKRPPGTPGTPGSRDLEAALRRLSLRRDNYLSEKRFFEEERERKLAYLAKEEEKGGGEGSEGPGTPTESLLSLCSHPSLGSVWSGYSFTARSYLPEKLQIVKPLEGDYPSQSHKSSNPPHNQKEKQNQIALHNENEIFQKLQKNQNQTNPISLFPHAPQSYTRQTILNQQQNQYLIFHRHSQSKLFLGDSCHPKSLQRSSSLMELSSLPSSQPQLRAPLALVTGSATLHAWQQLAQPHMGALLDHRPGVVTKGFRTLAHEHEQDDSWQMDQPEEDEVSCDLFACSSGESSALLDLPRATSTPSVCRNKNDVEDNSLSETLCGETCGAREAIQGKDRHVANVPLRSSSPTLSSSVPSSSEMNGHVDLKELDHMPVNFPGKCMSHTSSTYTFTTCRILHPSDQLTTVSSSPAMASCQSNTCIGSPTPNSSPIPFSAPHTPSYTPCCTPRRLSLSLSLAESSTNLRDSTKTTSTSLGLVHLLLEHGISASVYDPCSWDRGLDTKGASTPVAGAQTPRCSDRPAETEDRWLGKRPDTLLLLQPSTPPNSPRSCSKSASSTTTCPVFQFSPSNDNPPYYDTFLASKPARTILREVLGEVERERGGQTDDDSQTEMLNLRLVDKLKRFRTVSPHAASVSSGSTLLAPFGATGLGNSTLGGGLPVLNAGLRRNRSYPAMVGASMAMKDPGGPPTTEILIPHTMQAPHTVHTRELGKLQTTNHTLVTQTTHRPQTLHALETVAPQTITQRQVRPNKGLQDSTSNDDETGT
ncbi:hypothetical protein PAMP_002294 [Pampus punctatissimus]